MTYFYKTTLLLILLTLTLGSLGYGGYRYYTLTQHSRTLEQNFTQTQAELASTTKNLREYITSLEQERDTLKQDLLDEQTRLNALAAQVEGVINVVGVLEKLNQIDQELLKKYSRVYFLNENYIPKELVAINNIYLYEPQKIHYILTDAALFLDNLMTAAKNESIDLVILSAYRSFGTQAEVKSSYTITYGSGANQFSADQGYSEHQLGTTVDFSTQATGKAFNEFKSTPAYIWLQENAHIYGFIPSYPENNTYYRFEPWHWRFIGKELAGKLHAENKDFYNLDQRLIDTYLISLFD